MGLSERFLFFHTLTKLNYDEWDDDDKRMKMNSVPILLSSKFVLMGACAIHSIYFWPIWAYSDIMRTEAYIRGLPYKDYRITS